MKLKPDLIAHRGFWTVNPEVPENSLESLQNAQKLNIYGSEFDVRLTKDEVLVVYHDESIGDKEIEETSFSDFENYRLSNGEKLPTFESFLLQGKNNLQQKLIIELKPCKIESQESTLVQKTVELIMKSQSEMQCEFISFSLNICRQLKISQPNFRVSYLNGDLSPKEIKAVGLDGFDYDFEILMKNPNWIIEADAFGLISNSWTVNNKEVYMELSGLGIDFITTDFPKSINL